MTTDKKAIQQSSDLGLGDRVVQENRTRFLNKDGSFNVHRKGILEHGSFSLYHWVLSISWPRFLGFLVTTYLFAGLAFGALYLLCGPSGFTDIQNLPLLQRLGEIFFFSIHGITTVGQSDIQPVNALAKILSSIEALAGLLGLAVAAGLIFARFSNPVVKIIFSHHAVIGPYKNTNAFMARIINGRSNELVELKATLTVAMADKNGKRTFHQLELERDTIAVFPLNWTIVHPITKNSPLHGISGEELLKRSPEFLISISAIDEDLSKTVYARHSYIAKEVEVGAQFTNIFERMEDGTIVVDPKRIHETEHATVSRAPALKAK
jgi:inward rectifier potassium channel